jgi:hypothetical protein
MFSIVFPSHTLETKFTSKSFILHRSFFVLIISSKCRGYIIDVCSHMQLQIYLRWHALRAWQQYTSAPFSAPLARVAWVEDAPDDVVQLSTAIRLKLLYSVAFLRFLRKVHHTTHSVTHCSCFSTITCCRALNFCSTSCIHTSYETVRNINERLRIAMRSK